MEYQCVDNAARKINQSCSWDTSQYVVTLTGGNNRSTVLLSIPTQVIDKHSCLCSNTLTELGLSSD